MSHAKLRLVATILTVLLAVLMFNSVLAQDEAETTPPADATIEAESPPPPPAKSAKDPGRFAKGRKRAGFFAGAGSNFGETYLIIGGGLAYYVANGLEVGFDAEGWILQDPTFWKLTPQVRYILWQAGRLKPYVGAFYRWNLISGDYEDINSYGGRVGVAYQSGGNYLAVGAVYEKFESDWVGDDSNWYPEISIWISF